MRESRIEAVNLRQKKLNGYRLLTVFSREHGLLKLTGSKLGGRAEPLLVNAYWIVWGREDIHRIRSSEFGENFRALRQDLATLAWAWHYCELVEIGAPFQEERSGEIFELLVASLRELDRSTREPQVVGLWFLWSLLELIGYRPSIPICGRPPQACPAEMGEECIFEPAQGGVTCAACGQPSAQAVRLLPRAYATLRQLSRDEMLTSSRPTLAFVASLLRGYLETQTGKRLASWSMLREFAEPGSGT
jgi:DNA repair protein RecO